MFSGLSQVLVRSHLYLTAAGVWLKKEKLQKLLNLTGVAQPNPPKSINTNT